MKKLTNKDKDKIRQHYIDNNIHIFLNITSCDETGGTIKATTIEDTCINKLIRDMKYLTGKTLKQLLK
jgi:hypothetical protein